MKRPGAAWLWLPPLFVYISSYLYLSGYHGTFLPIFTVVHEGGKLSLWETTLYASHFLGHLPVIVTAALWFCGAWLCLTPSPQKAQPSPARELTTSALFLGATVVFSLGVFGLRETLDFVLQHKQSEAVVGEGGAWTLHLPSTMLLPALIGAFLIFSNRVFEIPSKPSLRGFGWLIAGVLVAVAMTWAVGENPGRTLLRAWSNPRYLGHSVRELLTFPLIYFPPALYFLIRERPFSIPKRPGTARKGVQLLGAVCLLILLIGLAYQSWTTLQFGVGELAQKPPFARGGQLGIPYLLSVHYFEHFLDAAFFVLLCRLLVKVRV